MQTWFLAQTPLMQTGLLILAVLALAAAVTGALQWRNPSGDYGELWRRIRSWWIMAGFFMLSMAIHPDASLVMFALLSFLALKEYFTLIHTRLEDHRVLFWAFLAIPIQYFWIKIGWEPLFFIFIPVYMFLFLPFRMMLTGKPSGMVASMGKIQWGLMAFVFCVSHLAWMMTLPPTAAIPGGGRALVLFLVFLTEINDVAQFVWGKLLGGRILAGHPIAPVISPKKTWAGFIGGVVSTVTLAVALRFLSGLSIEFSVYAGLLIAVAGFAGDLVVSAIKRDVGVKDASQLIPGHGGMLDRIDSLTYTAPLFFHFIAYFFY